MSAEQIKDNSDPEFLSHRQGTKQLDRVRYPPDPSLEVLPGAEKHPADRNGQARVKLNSLISSPNPTKQVSYFSSLAEVGW